jgi:SAM-dependent methyltransferase
MKSRLATRLREEFGEIDIHLFDQLLHGRIAEGMCVLDAGCGTGRNLVLLMREGFDVQGVDESADAIRQVQARAARVAPGLDANRFRVEPVEAMSVPDRSVDVVISSAVLHFARDDAHWLAMVREMWRVLAPGGILFARLAMSLGQPELRPLGGGRFALPDGSLRYLVDVDLLRRTTAGLGGTLVDPIKCTVVDGQRSMGTWIVRKDELPRS